MNYVLFRNTLLLFIVNIAPSLSANCMRGRIEGWKFNGNCYTLVKKLYYYIAAERYCHKIGAHLVSIHSEAEQNFLYKKVPEHYFWIGLNDERREGEWEWTDGTPFDHRHWSPGVSVNDDDKNCVFTYPTGRWGVGACSGEFKWFFCKYKENEKLKPILGKPALSNPAPPIGGAVTQADGVPPICRGSWTFNGYCYKLSDLTARSFTGAERQCQRMGGHLVSMHSQAEQKFLNSKIHSEYWIGLNDRQREGRWEWTDGSRVDHRYWSRGKRWNDHHKNCVLANDKGRWGLDACAGPRRYMCKTKMPGGFRPGPEPVQPKPARPEPAQGVPATLGNCNGGWIFNGFCYKLIKKGNYFISAERYCQRAGGHLASVHSEQEQNFLYNKIRGREFWIGLNDERREGDWEWTDGTPFDHRHWTIGQPVSDDDKNCVSTLSNGRWGVGACSGGHKIFFCKYNLNGKRNPILGKPALPYPAPIISGMVNLVGGRSPICTSGWKFNGNCYKQSGSVGRSFTGAERQCQRMGGHLVSLHSKAEQKFLYRKTKRSFWTGLHDRRREGEWEWTDATNFDYRYWSRGQPANSDKKNCVFTYGHGRWGVGSCAGPKSYICKTGINSSIQPRPVLPEPTRPEPPQPKPEPPQPKPEPPQPKPEPPQPKPEPEPETPDNNGAADYDDDVPQQHDVCDD